MPTRNPRASARGKAIRQTTKRRSPLRADTGTNGTGAKSTASASGAALTRVGFAEQFDAVVDNIGQVIKGKDEVVRMMLVALLADGHVLLEDMPGTGKTMLARAIAQSTHAGQNRVQCTPDLLPSDVTGAPIYDQVRNEFYFREGPVFTNILLVDEVNRATPKTQSALLEAMQERNITVDGRTYPLPDPFLVIATQNPIELAGTFPVPEAQLDRFLLKLSMGYAGAAHEAEILEANLHKEAILSLQPVVSTEDVLAMMAWATEVDVPESVRGYIIALCQETRTDPALSMGASTRAALAMMRAARVLAASQQREDVIPDDVVTLAKPVLAHRLVLTPDASLRGETLDDVIQRLLTRVKVPAGVAAL